MTTASTNCSRELPIRAGDLMALTSAFDGEAVSAQDQTARPSYITRQLAYFLLGATAYDRELDEDETQLVEVAENVLLSRRLTNGAWNTVPTTLFCDVRTCRTGLFMVRRRGWNARPLDRRQPADRRGTRRELSTPCPGYDIGTESATRRWQFAGRRVPAGIGPVALRGADATDGRS